jgi:hypothetical protein
MREYRIEEYEDHFEISKKWKQVLKHQNTKWWKSEKTHVIDLHEWRKICKPNSYGQSLEFDTFEECNAKIAELIIEDEKPKINYPIIHEYDNN